MELDKLKVLLVVGDMNNQVKYSDYLKDSVNFDLITTINYAYSYCLENYYDLILIDLKLSLGFGRQQIDRLNSLADSPPLFKIRPHEDKVEVILQEQRAVEELTSFLKRFFERLKEEGNPLVNLRKHVRYQFILRVVLKKGKNNTPCRANTLNISQGGLFITTLIPFDLQEDTEVDIYDITHDPIRTIMKVVWLRPWEVSHQLPGIGAQFLSFHDNTEKYTLIEYMKNSNNINKTL